MQLKSSLCCPFRLLTFMTRFSLCIEGFETVFVQLPFPPVLCVDFNVSNLICSSKHLNSKGRTIDALLEASDLVTLNNGSVSRINPGGYLSLLVLTMVS